MKRGDLVAGGEYAHRLGKHGDPRRCIVLDVEPVFDSPRLPYFTWHPTAASIDERLRQRGPTRRRTWPTQRVLVAIELDLFADGDHERPAVGTRWMPYAARCAEIVSPWADELARRAQREREAETARLAYEAAERQRAVEARRRQAEYDERQRQREIEREQERKRDAIRAERFEQRIEPALRELGFEPERDGERITLTLDDAERLSALLDRPRRREP